MSADGTSPATRHDSPWFDDGNVVLQAENSLFSVHRSVLKRESQLFNDMFAMPQPDDDGRSESAHGTVENPIPLHQVGAEAMANILTMVYTTVGVHLELDNAACIAVLKVAHRLQFHNILKDFSPLLPERLSAEEKLYLGLSGCGVDDWALPAFHKLIFGSDLHGTGAADGTPLLGHAAWNIIYSTRVQILYGRRSATSTLGSSNYCTQHLNDAWVLMCSSADTGTFREKLAPTVVYAQSLIFATPTCKLGKQGCYNDRLASKMSDTLTREEQLISDAWTKLKNDDTP